MRLQQLWLRACLARVLPIRVLTLLEFPAAQTCSDL